MGKCFWSNFFHMIHFTSHEKRTMVSSIIFVDFQLWTFSMLSNTIPLFYISWKQSNAIPSTFFMFNEVNKVQTKMENGPFSQLWIINMHQRRSVIQSPVDLKVMGISGDLKMKADKFLQIMGIYYLVKINPHYLKKFICLHLQIPTNSHDF